MISVQNLELRAGARLLMEEVTFRIDKGDKIGLVGRNGAGKTTMTKVLAGLNLPADGTITRSGSIGYLPQDPKVDDMSQLAKDRILSARALDGVARKMRQAQDDMASEDPTVRAKGMRRYDRLEAEFMLAAVTRRSLRLRSLHPTLTFPNGYFPNPCRPSRAGSAAAWSWRASSSQTRTRCYLMSPLTTWMLILSCGCEIF